MSNLLNIASQGAVASQSSGAWPPDEISIVVRIFSRYIMKEMPGPATFTQWQASFRVYRTALLMLEVLTMATMVSYESMIEKFTKLYLGACMAPHSGGRQPGEGGTPYATLRRWQESPVLMGLHCFPKGSQTAKSAKGAPPPTDAPIQR